MVFFVHLVHIWLLWGVECTLGVIGTGGPTPIGDRNAQPKRMTTLRKELGWRLVGCELIECYSE
eukprot:2609926-Pyramimonas_sp.AAC.1